MRKAILTFLIIASSAFLAGPAPGAQPIGTQAEAQAAQPELLDAGQLQDSIDRSLRWLRTQFDASKGSYGDLTETARALRAFGVSPRKYRPKDGPFIENALGWVLAHARPDGAIAMPKAAGAEAWEQTEQCVLALEALGLDPKSSPKLAAARTFLNARPAGADSKEPLDPKGKSLAQVSAAARALLAEREEAGFWERDKQFSRTSRSALALVALSLAHKQLKAAVAPAPPAGKANPLPSFTPADREATLRALERGARFLAEAAPDGHWGAMGRSDPGITAMVTSALVKIPTPRTPEVEESMARGLDWLRSLQKEDGSIHDGSLANYVTSSAIMAMAAAAQKQDVERIARARDFLIRLQADGQEGYGETHPFYGGVGYGGDERPDLSNLQMALDALAASGVKAGDPAFQKALRFLERCQNRSESNDISIADGDVRIVSGNDGGSGYAPGDSKAGFIELGEGRKVPRSYGSMTYALLKGYLFAGLKRDDPRVQAAWKWLCENYSLDVNPGFEASEDPSAAYQGLFYYFYTMSVALDLYGSETVTDAAGREHTWRSELSGRLLAMQRQDGSWLNDNSPRWWEGNPVLATAYAMLTLEAALPDRD